MTARRYAVDLVPAAARALRQLDQVTAGQVVAALDRLADQPRPRAARRLVEGRELYRLRAGGVLVAYGVDDGHAVVLVVAIARPQ